MGRRELLGRGSNEQRGHTPDIFKVTLHASHTSCCYISCFSFRNVERLYMDKNPL